MSRTNCAQCGAPYLTLGSRCDYCGTLKDSDGVAQSTDILYADDKPIECLTMFMDYDAVISKCLSSGVITINEARSVAHQYHDMNANASLIDMMNRLNP